MLKRQSFPNTLIKELGEIGAFGPYIPQKYGGAGSRPDKLWNNDARN